MRTDTKIRLLWEGFKKLTADVRSIGADVASIVRLPSTTSASAGQVLGLVGSSKALTWVDNVGKWNYSETEVNTGQKWIDGKDIYCKVYSDVIDTLTEATEIMLDVNITNIIKSEGEVYTSVGNGYGCNSYRSSTYNCVVVSTNTGTVLRVTAGYSGGSYKIILYYTKPDPETLTSPTPDDTRSIGTEEPEQELRSEEPETLEETIEEPKTRTRKTTTKKTEEDTK